MTIPNDADPPPTLQAPHKSPIRFAAVVGEYVRGALALMLWILVAAAGVAAFYVGLRAVWWGTQLVLKSVGV